MRLTIFATAVSKAFLVVTPIDDELNLTSSKLSELENNIAQSKLALDEAQRRLDTVEKSKKEYRSATELELKKRAEKGGWNLARDVHDSSRRVSRIRWTRKKVSN